jgi:monoamine oxidase
LGFVNKIPWNENSVLALERTTYNPLLDSSLTELLLDDLGFWWKDPLHKFERGMESFVHGFLEEGTLKENIIYGIEVTDINYSKRESVEVSGESIVGRRKFNADAVVVTVPLNIMGNINFYPLLPKKKQDAISKVNYAPSTKVHVQFRKQFWLKENLRGGFTKSTSNVGQLHYPTNTKENLQCDENKRGVLVCYTWDKDALVWQSMPVEDAVARVANEVARIHATKPGTAEVDDKKRKEILSLVEGGKVQAWYGDPYSQGAFVLYKAYSKEYFMDLVFPVGPEENLKKVFFAGEGISYTHGWIQGALESGIMAASVLHDLNESFYV